MSLEKGNRGVKYRWRGAMVEAAAAVLADRSIYYDTAAWDHPASSSP